MPNFVIGVAAGYPSLVKKPYLLESSWNDDSLNQFFGGLSGKVGKGKIIRSDFMECIENSSFKTVTQLLSIVENSIKKV